MENQPDLKGSISLSAAGTSPPVLEVENLQTEFHLRTVNVRAVDAVSFSVRSGECLGLVGESGCGKTTIGLSVMKLLPNVGHISGGEVRLNGRDLVPLAEPEMRKVRGNDIGMIFQDPMTSLNPTWTIGRQIAEPVRIHQGASKKEALDRAVEVLRLVGMPRPEERLQQYPHQLSGGLRQRVMIAMALACQPKLLIADEPTTALDVTIQAQILDLIDELRQTPRHGRLAHHSRHGRHRFPHGPGNGHVRRQDHRGRQHRRPLRYDAAPLLGSPLRVHPPPQPGPARTSLLHPGAAAGPGPDARWVPLPPPLPLRDGGVRQA